MANYVRIATIGPRTEQVNEDLQPQEMVEHMIGFWKGKLNQVLPDRPDLIVVSEVCDKLITPGFSIDQLTEYYRVRKDQVRDFFAATGKEHHCNIVYSAARQADDGTWRNSNVILDRSGNIAGIYNKNHLTIDENEVHGKLYGKEAPLIECDFGKVACAICFDLNFDELLSKYVKARPDLIIFSSMYHGGLRQTHWAYSCRCYFVGAISEKPSQIRNPFGEVVASTTNYRDFAVADVNLDCCLAHLDYNGEKLTALKAKYGPKVNIHDPGYVGSVLISSQTDELGALEMAKEFEIELLDDYFARALAHRHAPGHMET